MARKVEPEASWGTDVTGPFWAAQAYPPRAGQDHLGLGSVSSDRILPRLSPGINVLTIHPRYWSFYAFVLDEFWARDLPRTRAVPAGSVVPAARLLAVRGFARYLSGIDPRTEVPAGRDDPAAPAAAEPTVHLHRRLKFWR